MAFGIAIAVVMLAAVIFAYNAVNGNPLAERKTISAAFEDVNGLLPGDDVRIASDRVGYVEEVRLEGRQAVAVLKLDDPTTKVYHNASASVGARSALGQKFVSLDPGNPKAGELPAGETIPEGRTRSSEDLTDLFDVFDGPTRQATGTVLREVGGGMAGRSQDLNDFLQAAPGLLDDLGTVSRSVAVDRDASLTRLLRSAERLASRFEGRENEIRDLTRQLGTTMKAVAVDNGEPLKQSLQQAPETLRATRAALTSLNGPLAHTETAVRTLRPGATALGAAAPDLRGVLREGVAPLDKVPAVSSMAEPAVGDLTGLMKDARPLTPRVVRMVDLAATPLSVLAPYSTDISGWFTAATNMLSNGDDAGHWGRFLLVPRSESVAGTAPIKDPTVSRNSYPAPGEAAQDSADSPVIGGRR